MYKYATDAKRMQQAEKINRMINAPKNPKSGQWSAAFDHIATVYRSVSGLFLERFFVGEIHVPISFNSCCTSRFGWCRERRDHLWRGRE
jgi:hypothetical protein